MAETDLTEGRGDEPDVNTARHLLEHGVRALLLCTDGRNFEIRPDDTGFSGNWRLNPNREVDTVLIYHDPGQGRIRVYEAAFAGLEGPNDDEGRYKVALQNI